MAKHDHITIAHKPSVEPLSDAERLIRGRQNLERLRAEAAAHIDLLTNLVDARASAGKPAKTSRRLAPPVRPLVDVASFPNIYALQLEGACLEPDVPDGAAIVLQKSIAVKAGDIVCIWWRPEVMKPGMYQGWCKRLVTNVPPFVKGFPFDDHPQSELRSMVIAEQMNPERRYSVACKMIHAMHKVTGYMLPSSVLGSMARGEIIPIG